MLTFDGHSFYTACSAFLALTHEVSLQASLAHLTAAKTEVTLFNLLRFAFGTRPLLHVSLDDLVFGENERGPDDALKFQFQAVSELEDANKLIIREILEGLIIKYQAKR